MSLHLLQILVEFAATEGGGIKRGRFNEEQIIAILNEQEAELGAQTRRPQKCLGNTAHAALSGIHAQRIRLFENLLGLGSRQRSLVRHAAQVAQGSGLWSALALQNRWGPHKFGIRGNGQI